MKRIIGIIGALALSLNVFTSCGDFDYYEPAFYNDTIDWTISALGGEYPVQYKYVYYTTKSLRRDLDFVYRLIIDGEATDPITPTDIHSEFDSNEDCRIYTFFVTIPKNNTGHYRSILVEASTHIDYIEEEDYWTEWFPVISTVQMF